MINIKIVTAILLSGALLIATASTTFAKKPEVSPAEKEETNTNKKHQRNHRDYNGWRLPLYLQEHGGLKKILKRKNFQQN
ncbi:MAG: hypothetical protein LBJ83_00785 [Oscillospiraceae bacterium]|jgi:hypothetical protein|nr:hypothetical protein [Oscillospiraceae bacterium]